MHDSRFDQSFWTIFFGIKPNQILIPAERLLLRPLNEDDAPTVHQLISREIADTAVSIPYPFPDSEAEASAGLRDIVERADLNWNCPFPAGTAYRLYKTRGGRKPRMLADFLIAAHLPVPRHRRFHSFIFVEIKLARAFAFLYP
jgi:hypothetical protein